MSAEQQPAPEGEQAVAPASPTANRKTKLDTAGASGGGSGGNEDEDGTRKRTKVGGAADDGAAAAAGTGLLIPAAAAAASQAAAAGGAATTTTAAPAAQQQEEEDTDILHRCLRLTDSAFVMIPVPKIFAPNPANPLAFQLECAVPKAASGHLIGRQGAKIKSTREVSGAGVKMLDHVGMASFRCIVITGTFQQCRTAFGIIAEQVNDLTIPTNAPAVPGQHTLTLLVPNNKMGGLIGQKGAVINEFRSLSGAQIALAKPDDMNVGSLDRVVTVTGEFTQVQRAWALVSEKLTTIVPTKENTAIQRPEGHGGFMGGGMHAGPHGGHGHGMSGGGAGARGGAGQLMTQNVIVTNDQAGIIIGRGGQHINEMRRYVGCEIHIDASRGGEDPQQQQQQGMRNVRIVGTAQQIQLAQSLILNKIQQAAASQHHGGAGMQPQQQQQAQQQFGVPSGHDQQYRPQQQQPSLLNAYGQSQAPSYGHVGQPLGYQQPPR